MIKQLAFVFLVTVVSAEVIHNYKDCGSKNGLVKSISISPCPQEPCFLKRDTNVSVSIVFTSKVNTSHVTTKVHGILLFIPIPFNGVPKDACANHNVDHCPITAGETLTYTNAIYVDPIYPLIRVGVKFEVRDDNDVNLVCFVFPTEIIN